MTKPALLNLGCGAYSHPAFVNVDLVAAPGVIGHDLRQGIPFPDQTYDLVYHSTMLSHLRPPDAANLTRECHRVLKPGGILRIVTEDLEQMCRVYLQKLEAICQGDRGSERDYDWMVLELYDQATREVSGGQMLECVRQDRLPNEAFLSSRIGALGRRLVEAASKGRVNAEKPASTRRGLLASARSQVKKLVLTAVLGRSGLDAYELGRFRLTSGQVSYRMYDRFSLERLFRNAGFSHMALRSATESSCPFWQDSNLDVSSDGQAARPHTLIMEGIRVA